MLIFPANYKKAPNEPGRMKFANAQDGKLQKTAVPNKFSYFSGWLAAAYHEESYAKESGSARTKCF